MGSPIIPFPSKIDMRYFDSYNTLTNVFESLGLNDLVSSRRTALDTQVKGFRRAPIFEPELNDDLATMTIACAYHSTIEYNYFPDQKDAFDGSIKPSIMLQTSKFVEAFKDDYSYAKAIFPAYNLPQTFFNLWFIASNRRVITVLPQNNTSSLNVAKAFYLTEDMVGTYLKYTQDLNKIIILSYYDASVEVADSFASAPIEWLKEVLLPKTRYENFR